MAEEDISKMIKITVKTPKEKQDIEIDAHAYIKELRELVSQKFNAPVEQLCLIFAGKILKDEDKLEQHSIKDGLTVHLVIKSTNRSQEQAAQRATGTPDPSGSTSSGTTGTPSSQPPDVGQTPFGLGGLGGLAGLGNMGMGSANFMEMQQRMQRELMGNPDMLRQMMDNPMVQSLMSNPEVMRQMITSNPQMRELMERNPEITHMLNNPELMRQTMELARNPAMMQELMRSQDRAMSNLESLPGGFNALQRMYRDIQEPMLNAAQEGMGQNPFAALVNSGSGAENVQQGRENTDPLPNPWAPSSTQSSSTTTSTPSGTSSSSTPQQPTGLFESPGMQSLMSQITQNPQLMENMIQAPYMQAMLQQLSANPEMAQNILAANPMFSGNPQLQEQMRTQLPNMIQQLQNPNVQQFLTNPRAMQAMMRIQQGMQELEQEAPGMFPGLNPMMTRQTTTTPTTPTESTSTTNPSSTGSTSTTTNTTTTTPTPISAPSHGGEQMSNLMAHMMNLMAQGSNNQAPEQRYGPQLEQMAAMGFIDREQNLRALIATFGNVNEAIDRILSSNS